MAKVDFYFDFQSPWAYLASTRIERICADAGATLTWKPVLLDRVKELVGRVTAPYDSVTMQYIIKDAARWAERYGVPVNMPVVVSTEPMLRGCFLARDMDFEARYIHRVFQARWADSEDLSDEAVIRAIAADCTINIDLLFQAMQDEETARQLEEANQEAAARGVFGVPMTFVDDEPFWGNDRLDFVVDALTRTKT